MLKALGLNLDQETDHPDLSFGGVTQSLQEMPYLTTDYNHNLLNLLFIICLLFLTSWCVSSTVDTILLQSQQINTSSCEFQNNSLS